MQLISDQNTLATKFLVFWIGKRSIGHMPPVGVEPATSCVKGDIYLLEQAIRGVVRRGGGAYV